MEDSFKKILLEAPDAHLDAAMKPLIQKWDEPAKAIQILEVLDQCVFCSLASGFTMYVLNVLYEDALKRENTTWEEVEKLATWRDRMPGGTK